MLCSHDVRRRFHSLTLFGLACLSLLSLASPARAVERTIYGDGTAWFNHYSAEIRGSGNVLHLGDSGITVELDWNAWDLGYQIVPVSVRLSAASDDHVFAAIDADFDMTTDTLLGTITFQGGTGRFADASGEATLLVLFNDWQGPFDWGFGNWYLEGTIDY